MLGADSLDSPVAEQTAGAVLKYSEDLQTVRATGFAALASGGVLTPGGAAGPRGGRGAGGVRPGNSGG